MFPEQVKPTSGDSCLLLAAIKGETAVVRKLLDNGEDVNRNWRGQSALIFLTMNDVARPLTILRWHGLTMLDQGESEKHSQTAQVLLDRGAEMYAVDSKVTSSCTVH